MNCPNGCTDHDDRPLKMEFAFSTLGDNQPGYQCPECGYFETQRSRGRI